MKPMMRLEEAAAWFIRVRVKQGRSSEPQFRRVAECLSEHLNREATVQDLNPLAAGSMVRQLLKSKAESTVKRMATDLVTLWRWCASVGLADKPTITANDLMAWTPYVPKRTREKPTHQRRSEEELLDWLFRPEA